MTAGLLLWLALGQTPHPPTVRFTLDFPASVPAWAEVTIAQDGAATFAARQTASGDAETLAYTASPAIVAQAFAAAQRLHDFAAPPLEAPAHVAFSGNKTLRYDDGAVTHSQTYNYTTLPAAAALTSLMERTIASGEHALLLTRAARFEPLGVLEEVQRIQSDWQAGELAEPALLAPALRAVVADDTLMNSARTRAAELLRRMKAAR